MGTGGIATFAQNLVEHWQQEDVNLKLWKVPRSNLRGWITYIPNLFAFAFELTFRKPSLVHVNLASKGSPLRKFAFVYLALCLKIPLVTQIHSGAFARDLGESKKGSIWNKVTLKIISASNLVIFINHKQMDEMIQSRLVQPGKSAFLANHIPVPRQISAQNQKPMFDGIFVGRVSKDKGAEDLLISIASLPHSKKFAFVGKISIPGITAPSVHDYGENQVTFLGELSHEDTLNLIEKSSFLILPSYSENFPMVILEASARGKPVIATNVGEIGQIVRHNSNGLLIEPGDVSGLARCIIFYLENPQIGNTHGLAARALVEQKYDLVTYPTELLSLYSDSGLI